MPEQFVGKVGTKGILVIGRRVLMVRAENETAWDLPGGRINVGESASRALERELKEELGISVVVGSLLHSCQVVHTQDGTNQLFLTFLIAATSRMILSIPTDEVAEIRWVSEDEVEDLVTYDNCRAALKVFWLQY